MSENSASSNGVVRLSVGDSELLKALWPLLPADGCFKRVPHGTIAQRTNGEASGIPAGIQRLMKAGVLLATGNGKGVKYARGEFRVLEIRKRSDSPNTIFRGSIDELLASEEEPEPTADTLPPELAHDQDDGPAYNGLGDPTQPSSSILFYVTPQTLKIKHDVQLGQGDVMVGWVVWQHAGLGWVEMDLEVLSGVPEVAHLTHPSRSLVRLLQAGVLVLRADGKIRRGNAKITMTRAGLMTGVSYNLNTCTLDDIRKGAQPVKRGVSKFDPLTHDQESPNAVLGFCVLLRDRDAAVAAVSAAERALKRVTDQREQLAIQLKKLDVRLPELKDIQEARRRNLAAIERQLAQPEFEGCERLKVLFEHTHRGQYGQSDGGGDEDSSDE